MRPKRTGKPVFFVVFLLILALTYTAFFGVENYYGDTRNVYVKGANDIRWGIDIRGGVEAVFSPDKADVDITAEDMDAAKAIIEDIVFVPEIGERYTGTVVRIMQFGAFVEISSNVDGMIHISKLSTKRVERVEDVVKIGDKVEVEVIKVDEKGRVDLKLVKKLS